MKDTWCHNCHGKMRIGADNARFLALQPAENAGKCDFIVRCQIHVCYLSAISRYQFKYQQRVIYREKIISWLIIISFLMWHSFIIVPRLFLFCYKWLEFSSFIVSGSLVTVDIKKVKKVPKDPAIKEGSSLPNDGTCKHYKKSFRWLRYKCIIYFYQSYVYIYQWYTI